MSRQASILENLFQIWLEIGLSWREEVPCEELFATTNLAPMVISLLNSEQSIAGIDLLVWLAHRLLQTLPKLRVFHFIGVPGERDRLLVGWRRAESLSDWLDHLNLDLHVLQELTCILSLFEMVELRQIIEGCPHILKLLDGGVDECAFIVLRVVNLVAVFHPVFVSL